MMNRSILTVVLATFGSVAQGQSTQHRWWLSTDAGLSHAWVSQGEYSPGDNLDFDLSAGFRITPHLSLSVTGRQSRSTTPEVLCPQVFITDDGLPCGQSAGVALVGLDVGLETIVGPAERPFVRLTTGLGAFRAHADGRPATNAFGGTAGLSRRVLATNHVEIDLRVTSILVPRARGGSLTSFGGGVGLRLK